MTSKNILSKSIIPDVKNINNLIYAIIDTYYYHLFKAMAELKGSGEETEKGGQSMEEELADIREDIIAVSARERQRYLDMLLQGKVR